MQYLSIYIFTFSFAKAYNAPFLCLLLWLIYRLWLPLIFTPSFCFCHMVNRYLNPITLHFSRSKT